MSDRASEPVYGLIDLHPDVDVDAAADAYATQGWTFVGRGAICRVDGVTYRRVSARRLGRVRDPARGRRRDPRQPYEVPPGWDAPDSHTAGAAAAAGSARPEQLQARTGSVGGSAEVS